MVQSQSEHLHHHGRAAIDFYVDGVSIYEVQDYCRKHWPHSVGLGAPKGFVHLGIGRGKSSLALLVVKGVEYQNNTPDSV